MIGKSIIRPDAYEKVLGKALFPDDLELPDMLYAGVKRSTIAYGKIKYINIDEIKKLNGVIDVIDYSRIPGSTSHGVIFKDIPILVKDVVKRVGDCILLVIANNKKNLKEALEKVKIEYEEYKGVFSIEEAIQKDAPVIGEKNNILFSVEINKGNIDEGFKEAKFISVNTYKTQMTEHAFMQPESTIANYNAINNTLDLYIATQYPHYDREEVARCLNMKEENINVINMTIGGAFGAREDINPQCHAAIASYITKRPVKIIYSREESTISHSKRHLMKMYYKTAVKSNGRLCALKARIYADTGAYASWGINVIRKAAVHATGPYEIPNVDIKAYAVYTNNPFCGAMRGFGAAQVPISYESQMDILSEKLNINPLVFRNINTFQCGSKTATGQILDKSVGIKECISKLASIDNIEL